MTRFALTVGAVAIAMACCPSPALAQQDLEPAEPAVVASLTPLADEAIVEAARLPADPQDAARPVAIEYSEGHLTRAKIHKYASFATLPLIATEFWLGQSLYNDPQSLSSSKRAVHGAVGAGLIGLFAVNSVTGVWNLVDSREAPGHTKRMVHGLMMLAAEGGFIAAAVSAPGHSRNALVNFDANKATHRNIAYVSMGVGTAGYLLMLFTGGGH